MYEPPSRNSAGLSLLSPTCPGGSCQWYSQGCTIGCPEISGLHEPGDACANPAEPMLTWEHDAEFLQYKDDGYGGDTKYHPWRYPGAAPVGDPCGTTAGGKEPLGQLDPPPGFGTGVDGSDFKVLPSLLEQTVWQPGAEVEVAWGLAANHGGGYQYRLCPAGMEALTEECFQRKPLEFVGDKQWLQFGNGFDKSNRLEIKAKRIGGQKVKPEGSTWTMNPIPGCKENGGRAKSTCLGPTFEPAPGSDKTYRYGGGSAPGIYGYGSGRCMGNLSKKPEAFCDPQEYYDVSFDFGIVDLVKIPDDLPEGHYILGFRWDCEMTKQIWSSCADVIIKRMQSRLRPSARGENAARAALVVFAATAESAGTRRQESAKSAGRFSPGGAAALSGLHDRRPSSAWAEWRRSTRPTRSSNRRGHQAARSAGTIPRVVRPMFVASTGTLSQRQTGQRI